MTFSLSPIHQDIFDYIVQFKKEHDGCPPSMRQIANTLGLSTSVIFDHLNGLAALGMIKRDVKGQSRMIEVVGGVWLAPMDERVAPQLRGLIEAVRK